MEDVWAVELRDGLACRTLTVHALGGYQRPPWNDPTWSRSATTLCGRRDLGRYSEDLNAHGPAPVCGTCRRLAPGKWQ